MESPIRILSSAGHEKQCHICGNLFLKASLPSHQRMCVKKRFNKGSAQRMVMSAGIYGHQTHPCASCMNHIPQHKMIAHLRVCKGSSHQHYLHSSMNSSHSDGSSTLFPSDTSQISRMIPIRSVRTAHEKRFHPVIAFDAPLQPHPPSSRQDKGLAIAAESMSWEGLNTSFHQMTLQTSSDPNGYGSTDLAMEEPREFPSEESLSQFPCPICQRTFNAQDRLEKHRVACQKSNKTRKVFDMTKARVQGTDMEKYVLAPGSKKKAPPTNSTKKPKKSNWREKHLQFIQAIRGAKGVPVKNSPEKTSLAIQNDDLVSCPTCHRSFNEDSAKRHIPMCQSKALLQKREPKRGDVKKDELLKKRMAFKPPKPSNKA